MTITDLEPKLVFGIFDEITKVPRPSKKEGKIREFLLEFAKRHNIEAKTDPIGNVAMRVPATAGKALRQWCFRDTWIWCPTRPSRKHIISTPIRF